MKTRVHDSPNAPAVRKGFEDLAFADRADRAISAIARLAGWDKISGRIVKAIPVNVIHDQVPRLAAGTELPLHQPLAPVAFVDAWTNLIEENFPVLQDSTITGGQGMGVIPLEHPVASFRLLPFGTSPGDAGAFRGAEFSRQRGSRAARTARECLSALNTNRSGHECHPNMQEA